MSTHVERPGPDEYAPYYEKYVGRVASDDVVRTLGAQIETTLAFLQVVSTEDSLRRYAPGKWSVREVVGHMIDTERIFAYRALRFARNDRTELPGFEQDDYMPAARFDERLWHDLLAELEFVRGANILMFRGLDEAAWLRRGVASGCEMSVRALAYSIAGHELHHMEILRTRYLVLTV
jgi:hypothetical protein